MRAKTTVPLSFFTQKARSIRPTKEAHGLHGPTDLAMTWREHDPVKYFFIWWKGKYYLTLWYKSECRRVEGRTLQRDIGIVVYAFIAFFIKYNR